MDAIAENVSLGSTFTVHAVTFERPLSDPEAAIAVSPNERPILAETRPSRTARVDPKRPFKFAGANVRYRIVNRSFVGANRNGRFRIRKRAFEGHGVDGES